MLDGVGQHFNVCTGVNEIHMVETFGPVAIVSHCLLTRHSHDAPRIMGAGMLYVDDKMRQAWAESRLCNVDQGLDAELNQGELPLGKELSGEGAKQQGLCAHRNMLAEISKSPILELAR